MKTQVSLEFWNLSSNPTINDLPSLPYVMFSPLSIERQNIRPFLPPPPKKSMMIEVGVIRNRLVLLHWRLFYILASGEFLFRSSQDKPRFITSSIDACRLTLSTACIHRHSSRRARKDACATRNARGAAHWLCHRGKCAKSHCKSNRPTATRSHSAHRDSRSPQMSSLRRSREFSKAEMRQ